jgi:hypothetical protein
MLGNNLGAGTIERGREAYSDWINNYLIEARTREYWIEQKALLLKQPLFGASGPAYLLGYLAIKRAYLFLRRVSPGYFDTDIFLLLMLQYWFSDKATANQLVSLDDLHVLRVQQTIGDMSELFQDRWDDLYSHPGKVAQELLAKTEHISIQKINPTSTLGRGIGIRTAGDSLNLFVPKFYKHRLVLRLGMLRVNIKSDKAKRVADIWDAQTNERLLQCPLAPLADTGEFPGSIEIIRTYNGQITAVVILGGSGLVAVRALIGKEWNSPELTRLFDDLPSFEFVEASVAGYRQSPFAKRWEEADYSDIDRNVMDAARELCTSSYLQLAFRGASQGQRSKAMASLEGLGFKALFPEERDLNELALLSLHFGGPGTPVNLAAKRLERSTAMLAAQLKDFNARVRPALGVDLFELEGDVATAAL